MLLSYKNFKTSLSFYTIYTCMNCSKQIDTLFLKNHSEFCKMPHSPACFSMLWNSFFIFKDRLYQALRLLKIIRNSMINLGVHLKYSENYEKLLNLSDRLERFRTKYMFEADEINEIEQKLIFSTIKIPKSENDFSEEFIVLTIPDMDHSDHYLNHKKSNIICSYCILISKLISKFYNIDISQYFLRYEVNALYKDFVIFGTQFGISIFNYKKNIKLFTIMTVCTYIEFMGDMESILINDSKNIYAFTLRDFSYQRLLKDFPNIYSIIPNTSRQEKFTISQFSDYFVIYDCYDKNHHLFTLQHFGFDDVKVKFKYTTTPEGKIIFLVLNSMFLTTFIYSRGKVFPEMQIDAASYFSIFSLISVDNFEIFHLKYQSCFLIAINKRKKCIIIYFKVDDNKVIKLEEHSISLTQYYSKVCIILDGEEKGIFINPRVYFDFSLKKYMSFTDHQLYSSCCIKSHLHSVLKSRNILIPINNETRKTEGLILSQFVRVFNGKFMFRASSSQISLLDLKSKNIEMNITHDPINLLDPSYVFSISNMKTSVCYSFVKIFHLYQASVSNSSIKDSLSQLKYSMYVDKENNQFFIYKNYSKSSKVIETFIVQNHILRNHYMNFFQENPWSNNKGMFRYKKNRSAGDNLEMIIENNGNLFSFNPILKSKTYLCEYSNGLRIGFIEKQIIYFINEDFVTIKLLSHPYDILKFPNTWAESINAIDSTENDFKKNKQNYCDFLNKFEGIIKLSSKYCLIAHLRHIDVYQLSNCCLSTKIKLETEFTSMKCLFDSENNFIILSKLNNEFKFFYFKTSCENLREVKRKNKTLLACYKSKLFLRDKKKIERIDMENPKTSKFLPCYFSIPDNFEAKLNHSSKYLIFLGSERLEFYIMDMENEEVFKYKYQEDSSKGYFSQFWISESNQYIFFYNSYFNFTLTSVFEVQSRILKSLNIYTIGNDFNHSLFYKDLIFISCYQKVSILFKSLDSSITFGLTDKDYSFDISLLPNKKLLVILNINEMIIFHLNQDKFIINKKIDLGFPIYVRLFIQEEENSIIAICGIDKIKNNLVVYSFDENIKVETFLDIKISNLIYFSKCRKILGFCNDDSLNFVNLKH